MVNAIGIYQLIQVMFLFFVQKSKNQVTLNEVRNQEQLMVSGAFNLCSFYSDTNLHRIGICNCQPSILTHVKINIKIIKS